MNKELAAIKAPIASELEAFERHFRDSVRSRVALLDKGKVVMEGRFEELAASNDEFVRNFFKRDS